MTKENKINYPPEIRLEVASRIFAGFASNPAVFAGNPQNGWALVNCTQAQLVQMAIDMADAIIAESYKRHT